MSSFIHPDKIVNYDIVTAFTPQELVKQVMERVGDEVDWTVLGPHNVVVTDDGYQLWSQTLLKTWSDSKDIDWAELKPNGSL